jgi:hypothetical protein
LNFKAAEPLVIKLSPGLSVILSVLLHEVAKNKHDSPINMVVF